MRKSSAYRMYFFRSKLWLLGLIHLLLLLFTPAAKAVPVRSSLPFSHTEDEATPPRMMTHVQKDPIQTRGLKFSYLGGGRNLQYKTFTPFADSWRTAANLHHFWTQIAIHVLNQNQLPDSLFHENTFALHTPIKAGLRGDGLDLLFEVISFAGPIRREFVAAIATTMMEYSTRGFCGVFKARLTQGPGTAAIWITLTVRGLAQLQASENGHS